MFPPELVIHILAFLDARSDKPTLRNCALVSSTWLSAAQPIIFNHLSLSLTSPHHEDHESLSTKSIAANERLVEVLDAHPRLVSYIQSVRLKNFEIPNFRLANIQWVKENDSVASVVKRLFNVRSLSLFRMGPPEALGPSLRDAIYRLFQLPSIGSLEVSHSRFTSFWRCIHLASSPPNLAHISFSSISFVRTEDPIPVNTSLHPVYHLHLGMTKLQPFAFYFASTQCPFDFSGLKSLRLTNPRDGGAQSVLALVGGSLKHLELLDLGNDSTGFNLNDHTPNLRSLVLRVRHTPTHSPVPWIRALFTTLESRSSSIETITLRVEMDVPEEEQLLPTLLAPWRSIDTLLSDSSAFPFLQSVSLDLNKESDVSLDLLRDEFPSLIGIGKIYATKEWKIYPSATTWR